MRSQHLLILLSLWGLTSLVSLLFHPFFSFFVGRSFHSFTTTVPLFTLLLFPRERFFPRSPVDRFNQALRFLRLPINY
jgi:hypothetical protein